MLALASAKRIGELQALQKKKKKTDFGGNNVFYNYVNTFIAKTDSLENSIPRSFTIKGLADLAGNLQERLLCPVRVLKFYLNRLDNLGGSHPRLFCSISNPSRPLSKNDMRFCSEITY